MGLSCYIALLVVSRVIASVYLVVAIFGFPQTRKLLKSDYELDGSTLLFPLIICQPKSIQIKGTTVTYDASEVSHCQNLNFLVNSCAASLVFSIAAIIAYLVVDGLTRKKVGPFNRSAVAGMGLFLLFILIQTGVSFLALYAECSFWSTFYNDLYQKSGFGSQYGITDVTSYANQGLLMATAVLALATAVFIFLDAAISICLMRRGEEDSTDNRSGATPAGGELPPTVSSPESVHMTSGEIDNSDNNNVPSWATY